MKVSKLLLAASLPIWSAACASLPGMSIVDRPPERTALPALPPPTVCLAPIDEPAAQPLPTLPDLAPAPAGQPRETVAWWRQAAQHFEVRARRAELTQSFASSIAEEERLTRRANADNQRACADELRARDALNAPVG